MNPIVRRAIEAAGSPSALAAAAGVKLPSIYSWSRIPQDRLEAVEKATGIPRHELRPDLAQLFGKSSSEGTKADAA